MKKKYIAAPNHFKNYFTYKEYPEVFRPIDKYPIRKIKFNKKYLAIPNAIREEDVNYIVNEFNIEGWEPIYINEKGYLIDGQHRLTAAKKMKMDYIDVVLLNEEKMK